jgi:hypothetical protein
VDRQLQTEIVAISSRPMRAESIVAKKLGEPFVHPYRRHEPTQGRQVEDELPAYHFTAVGRELLRLGSYQPSRTYLRAIGEHLVEKGLTVSVGTVREISDTQTKFSGCDQIGLEPSHRRVLSSRPLPTAFCLSSHRDITFVR